MKLGEKRRIWCTESSGKKKSKHCCKLALQYLCKGNCGLVLNNKTVKYKNNKLSLANKCKALSAQCTGYDLFKSQTSR